MRGLIDGALASQSDIELAAAEVYRRAAARILERFSGAWKSSGGTAGFVTIQDDPRRDEDSGAIIREALGNRGLGPNYMAKIPVIRGGIEAIEACVEEGLPVCATEIFSLSQARRACEAYLAASKRSGKKPFLFVTHISGIFDEYLAKVAAREGIPVDEGSLKAAGLSVARREHALIRGMGIPTAFLMGGGARGPQHFTGLVGGDAHITINWSTAREILDAGTAIESSIDRPTPQGTIDELREKFADFRKAYDEGGLPEAEFAGYGPVQLFRNMFLKGWYLLLAEVASRKAARAL